MTSRHKACRCAVAPSPLFFFFFFPLFQISRFGISLFSLIPRHDMRSPNGPFLPLFSLPPFFPFPPGDTRDGRPPPFGTEIEHNSLPSFFFSPPLASATETRPSSRAARGVDRFSPPHPFPPFLPPPCGRAATHGWLQ